MVNLDERKKACLATVASSREQLAGCMKQWNMHPSDVKPQAITATAAANIIERMVHILVLRNSGSNRGCREPRKSIFRAGFPAGRRVCGSARMNGEIVERTKTDRIVTSFIVVTFGRIEQKPGG